MQRTTPPGGVDGTPTVCTGRSRIFLRERLARAKPPPRLLALASCNPGDPNDSTDLEDRTLALLGENDGARGLIAKEHPRRLYTTTHFANFEALFVKNFSELVQAVDSNRVFDLA